MDHPLKRDYKPEEDESQELGPEDAAYYQSLIGVLRWIVELGRVDITTEVSACYVFLYGTTKIWTPDAIV